MTIARADDWPQFRGPGRDNISKETGLRRKWPTGGPPVLWTTTACQGYAGAAIHSGRVYFNDYSQDAGEWFVRCLTLDRGTELWRYAEKKRIRPNHGITRTVPATDGRFVFALDPKCTFHCLDAETGKEVWRKDLVDEYKTQIPPWYNGQNPLIESDRVVIGVGGEALLVAFEKATGKEIWRTPNPENWPLAHASVMPATLGGVKQYLWCTLAGPLGVRAADGQLLWHHARKFNLAVAPSPLAVGDDRVFMTAGYDAGSVMLRVTAASERFAAQPLFELTTEQWNSEVHTPILYQEHLYAVGKKNRGLFTCLDLDGRIAWTSENKASFDLGSFLLADGLFFVLDGQSGVLRLLDATAAEYRELDRAAVLSGDNVWGPMALSGGKLVLRDMTKMVCIDVGDGAGAGFPEPRQLGRFRTPGEPLLCLLTPQAATEPSTQSATAPAKTQYRKLRVLGGKGMEPGQFMQSLRGLTVDAEDRLYAVGDSRLVVFDPAGEFVRARDTERPGFCVAVGVDGKVYVGTAGQVEIFDAADKRFATWQDPEVFGLVTALALVGDDILVADGRGRCIRRVDRTGKVLQDIGKDNRMRGFLIPNGYLDFVVDKQNVIHVANSGMHRVERYSLGGELLGQFGHFDGTNREGFPGCCNPTNIALTPDGNIVVTEKAGPRVKVYTVDGKLLSAFGTDDFDPDAKNMDVAVDSKGRLYVTDSVRVQVVVYEPQLAASATQPTTAAAAEPPP